MKIFRNGSLELLSCNNVQECTGIEVTIQDLEQIVHSTEADVVSPETLCRIVKSIKNND